MKRSYKMHKLGANMSLERWMWIELIGFDSGKSDFGVKDYIDNMGFVPDILSFLLSSPDFIHQHDSMAKDAILPWDVCTYGGRNYGKDQGKPAWTTSMLKGLIEELHKYKIKVFCAVMSVYSYDSFHAEWVSEHKELLAVARDGRQIANINPLARFKTGEYYEEFFIKKLIEVTKDYNFDGFHCADGQNHLTLSLCASDYSDNMIGQFTESLGIILPEDIAGKSGDNNERTAKRANWIWRNMRVEWIQFYARRWEEHIGKVVAAMHGEGRQMIFQTSWTRDPFEAIYRYGVDYGKIARTGVDWFTVECAAGTTESGAELGMNDTFFPDFFYKVLATILLTKPAIRNSKMVALHFTHDMMENWEILRHLPTFLQKEGYFYPNLFCVNKDGRLDRCIDGFMICLANDIRKDEWKWLQNNWTNSFAVMPQSVKGATLVWSEKALENQLEDYVATRTAPVHTILYNLLLKGAPVFASVNIDDIDKVKGPIVVINHHLFPEDELMKISAYTNGVKILIGRKEKLDSGHDFKFEDVHSPNQLLTCVYGSSRKHEVKIGDASREEIPEDLMGVEDPLYYCHDIYSRKISESFLKESAKMISFLSGNVKITNTSEATILVVEKEKGKLRLFIGNNKYTYSHPEIDMGSDISSIDAVTEFPYQTIAPEGSRFIVRVPGKGIVVLDVNLK